MKCKKSKKALIKVLFLTFLLLLTTACATRSAPEPKFIPTVYVTASKECALVNSDPPFDEVKPGSEKWQELYCAPIWDLEKIKEKFNKCEVWAR